MNLDTFDLTDKQIFHSTHTPLPTWVHGHKFRIKPIIPNKVKHSNSLLDKFKEERYHKLLDTYCYRCGRKLVVSKTMLCDYCDLELTNQVDSDKAKDRLFHYKGVTSDGL